MHVLFVIPYFHGAWAYGGQPRSAYELAKGMVRRGHSVTVVTTDTAGPDRIDLGGSECTTTLIDGIAVYRYRNISNELAFYQRFFWPPAFFKDIQRHVQAADIVHIHELRCSLTVAAASAAKRQGVPYVISPHGGLQRMGKEMAKLLFDALWGCAVLQNAAGIAVISPIEQKDARHFAIRSERIFMAPNGLDLAPFETLPRPGMFREEYGFKDENIILFLGRLHPIKGADVLMKAVAHLVSERPDDSLRLVFAGPNDGHLPALGELSIQLGIQDRVTFTGYLDQANKMKALVDSSVVVVPSRSEVFALTAIEALLCGAPVIISSACGINPRPTEQMGALFFQSESDEDLALRLRMVLCDKKVKCAAAEGRVFVSREFSLEASVSKLEAVYSQITNIGN